MTNLSILSISYNYLIGTLPIEMGKIRVLLTIEKSYFYLVAEQLRYLSEFNMSENFLSGTIPSFFGKRIKCSYVCDCVKPDK